MECMTRAARQCTDAVALGVAQNSHRRATVRPRAFGAWVECNVPWQGCSARRRATLVSCA